MRLSRRGIFATLLLVTAPVWAHESTPDAGQSHLLAAAARGAAATVDAFHDALHRGDTRAAAALMAADALIFESGGVERTKAEYAAQHLPADAEFSRSVTSIVTRRTGRSEGSFAWIASEGRTTGTYKGRSLDLITTETMLLRKVGGSWKIVHIHWSSASKPKA